MRALHFFSLVALAALPVAAQANDTMSTLSAGGLVFVATDEVQMQSEDLYVSPDQVRVKYVFNNQTDHDVTSLVAFPLPDITGSGDFMVSIPTEDSDNIFGFATSFDGKPVDATLHQYVFATNLDYTDYLVGLGVPLEPFGQKTLTAIDALPLDTKVEMQKLGLVVPMQYSVPGLVRAMVVEGSPIDGNAKIVAGTRIAVVGGAEIEADAVRRWPDAVLIPTATADAALDALKAGDADVYVDATAAIDARVDALAGDFLPIWDVYDEKTDYTPVWTLKSTYSWQAVFPAGKTAEVEHSYKPSVGGTVAVTFLGEAYDGYDPATEYKQKYCTDADFVDTVRKTLPDPAEPYGAPYTESWLSYVWSTGGNWSGAIGTFHLTIDKGSPENLVSFCWDGEVKKTSPTTFEMEAKDWWPPYGRELEVLILNRNDPEPAAG